jgi:hypothetical protein
MRAFDRAFTGGARGACELAAPRSNWIRSIGPSSVVWFRTCGDYYKAAAMYERLSALSDAELARRGLSRTTLAQDGCAACVRAP